jgi:hypothetical protein
MADEKEEVKQEIDEFLTKSHESLVIAKREALAVLTAREGPEAVEAIQRSQLPLGGVLDSVIREYATHIADDYTFVGPYGEVVTKQELLQRLRTGVGIFEDFARTQHDIRVYGELAVSTSLIKVKGEIDGQEVDGQYWETHTMQNHEGRRIFLATQVTRVRELDALLRKALDCD